VTFAVQGRTPDGLSRVPGGKKGARILRKSSDCPRMMPDKEAGEAQLDPSGSMWRGQSGTRLGSGLARERRTAMVPMVSRTGRQHRPVRTGQGKAGAFPLRLTLSSEQGERLL